MFRNTISLKLQLSSFFFIVVLSILSSCSTSEKVALIPISGFGGTGYKPSGFGGTGIVGTITQFGSIWVNGVEVEYNKDTLLSSNLLPKDSLKLGKQVVLETLKNDDKTEATKISVYYPIAGKITHLAKGQITLNNTFVVETSNAKWDKGVELKVDEYVAINGFESSSKKWVATRVNLNPQHKVFYQEVPVLNFSRSVKQVLIESSASQLKNWKELNAAVDLLTKNQERIIAIGHVDTSGEIQIDAIQSYESLPKSASKKAMLEKYKSLVRHNKSSSKREKVDMEKDMKNQSNRSSGFGNGDSGFGGGSGMRGGGRH